MKLGVLFYVVFRWCLAESQEGSLLSEVSRSVYIMVLLEDGDIIHLFLIVDPAVSTYFYDKHFLRSKNWGKIYYNSGGQ